MRRGIVYSLISIFLFIALVIAGANINVRITNEHRLINQEIPARVDRIIYDTISRDVAQIFKTSVDYSDNLTIIESMPSNISEQLIDYEQFLIGNYSRMITSNVSFTNKEECLYIGNHTKITYGDNKTWFNLTSNETINYYQLIINISETRSNVDDGLSLIPSGVYINLEINDNSGQLIKNGYFNPNSDNTYNVTYDDGSELRIELMNHLLVNSTAVTNVSNNIDLIGPVYTCCEIKINNTILELKKEYKTIIK